jgi:hypothetical protein
MITLACDNCGQSGEIPEELAAEQDRCPRCGHRLREADDAPAALTGAETGGSAARRRSVVIRQRKRIGMVLGGLAGAALMPVLAYAGGPVGTAAVGAAAGLMMGILFAAEFVHLAGLGGAPRSNDPTWLNPWTILIMALAPAVGAYLGSWADELGSEMLLLATLGGLVLAGWIGARLGEYRARVDLAQEAAERDV